MPHDSPTPDSTATKCGTEIGQTPVGKRVNDRGSRTVVFSGMGWKGEERMSVGTHQVVVHERLDDHGVEACVQLTAEHRGGDVEAAADLALGEAVDVLRDVVGEFSAFAG